MKALTTIVLAGSLCLASVPSGEAQGGTRAAAEGTDRGAVWLKLNSLRWETYLDTVVVRWSMETEVRRDAVVPTITVKVTNDGGRRYSESITMPVPRSGSIIIPTPPRGEYIAHVQFGGASGGGKEQAEKKVHGFEIGGMRAQSVSFRSKLMKPGPPSNSGTRTVHPINVTPEMQRVKK